MTVAKWEILRRNLISVAETVAKIQIFATELVTEVDRVAKFWEFATEDSFRRKFRSKILKFSKLSSGFLLSFSAFSPSA